MNSVSRLSYTTHRPLVSPSLHHILKPLTGVRCVTAGHLKANRCDEKRGESSLRAHQVEDSDFRSGAEPDREAGNPDAAVHVELRASFFVQAADVGHSH